MKKMWSGIFSLVLLVCVLAGNMAFASLSNQSLMAVQTIAPAVPETVSMPVLMYHHMLKSPKRLGDYVVSPQQFESDLREIKSRGYTTISCQQVIDYFEKGTQLPEKPIMITFDDGYESLYEYAYSLLQQYEMKASVNIIGKYTDLYSGDIIKSVSYSHATWTQLREMISSGLVEVGNHTYELHQEGKGKRKGIRKLSSESVEQYRELLENDVGALNNEISKELGFVPVTFAYPFGTFSKDSDEILKDLGFKIIMTCEEKINVLNRTDYEQGDVIKIKRYNRASKYSTEALFDKFEKS